MVGERGFEPPTPWSRTMKVQTPSALSGVAEESASHFFSRAVVPKLYRESEVWKRRSVGLSQDLDHNFVERGLFRLAYLVF
jgi:hypothetical protein